MDFAATGGAPTFSISGTILESGVGLEGVFITLTPGHKVAVTNALGFYSFPGLADGATYTLTPAKGRYTFTPPARNVLVDGGSVPNTDWAATPPPPGYTVFGEVQDDAVGTGVPRAKVTLFSGAFLDASEPVQYGETGMDGSFAFLDIPDGEYWVRADRFGYAWTGQGQAKAVTVAGADAEVPLMSGELNGGPTWENFAASLIADRCLQCHRPEGETPVDPILLTYEQNKTWGIASSNRINNGTMPPGSPLIEYYKAYFALWRTADFPED